MNAAGHTSKVKVIYLIVNPPLMVYNPENGASLQVLPDKLATKFRKKIVDIIVRNWEKKEVKHRILSRNNSSRLVRALSAIRAGRAKGVEEMFMRKLLPGTRHLERLVP